MIQTKTFDIPKHRAREEYLKYLAACKQSPTADLVLIKKIYRELSLGSRVINVDEAIGDAGPNAEGLPLLAIARADQKFCRLKGHWTPRNGSRIAFGDTDGNGEFLRPRIVPERALSQQFTSSPMQFKPQRAMVPMIPPNIRPAGNLSKYWILFEAEWKPIPPMDPLLLRPIGGPFFVVLAHWNLTEVERAVLGAFRQQEG